MDSAETDRTSCEAEQRLANIDDKLRKIGLYRRPSEALSVIAKQLVLIHAELAGLRMAVAKVAEATETARRLRGKERKPAADSTRITYYVALQFIRKPDGALAGQRPIECPNADAAIACARRMRLETGGAVAFSRTGYRDLGEFEPAVVLATFGDVPEDLSNLQ